MRKIKSKKGFTLAELLVVVAIIGVLVAISVPIFNGKLEKARIATNQANLRSAKAAAVAEYLQADDEENDNKPVAIELDVKTGAITRIDNIDNIENSDSNDDKTFTELDGGNNLVNTGDVTACIEGKHTFSKIRCKIEADNDGYKFAFYVPKKDGNVWDNQN